MAFNIIAQPDSNHPVYNPVVFGLESDNFFPYTLPGFRYIFKFYDASNDKLFQTLKAAPNPENGYGIVDVSKALQSFISYDLDFNSTTPIIANNSKFEYYVKFGFENIESWAFTGFTHVTSGPFDGKVKLLGTTVSPFSISDSIKIIGNYYNNQYATIYDITGNDIIVGLEQLDGNPTDNGLAISSYGLLVVVDDLLSISGLTAYNEAIPFKDFPSWNEILILPQDAGGDTPESDILTNSPNYLQTYSEQDKYIIKPYQELYWNAFNNPIGDDEITLANTMIVENEFGDRWMLTDYTENNDGLPNWNDPTIKMRQFNVSPNNQNWINISPSWDGLPNSWITYGINPYTHINSDNSLSYSKYLDYWTTFSPGYDECDAISIEITQDPYIIGPATTTFQFTARPVGKGFNQRRVYHTLIDGKNAFLVSDVDPGPQRVWNLYMNDNFNPQALNYIYSVFTKRTSNSAPYGTTNGSSNNADAWKAFDGDPLTYWQTNDGTGTGTLTYNMPFTSAIGWARPYSYSLSKGFTTTNAPKSWTFQASRDGGSTWTILHTVTNSTSAGQYNSPQLNISQAYTRFRIVVTAVVAGSDVRIVEFSMKGLSRIARMVSSNDCPISGGFLYWAIQGGPIPEYTSLLLGTTAVGPYTYPTLKPRRVYLDYTCQDNETQILFLDRAGSWSSFAFPLKVQERMDNEKLGYRTNIGFVEDGQWTYNTYDAEAKTYHSNVKKQYNLTTNFLNDSMDTYFQELISSPVTYVKLKDSTTWLSCNVLTKSLEPITRRLKQRTITIELNSQDNINI